MRDLVQQVGERVGALATAKAVYGEPVERGEITVIPVARATWGFGGGSGGDTAQQGAGGGGGGWVQPIGFIEVRPQGAQFKPIRDPRRTALLGAAAATAAALMLRRLGG
jgi:uncharacterized spore protein YtfJ